MNSKQEKLVAEFMAGTSSGEELLELCRKDAGLLNGLADLTVMERLLSQESQDASPELFCAEIKARLSCVNDGESFALKAHDRLKEESRAPAQSSIFQLSGLMKLAAAALFVAVMSYYLYANQSVAVLTNSVAADWGDKSLGSEQTLKRGLVELKAGCAELRFRNNVVVMLEGPARLEIKSVDHIVLYQGDLVANVPKNAIGFRVDTPSSEVVDLGTVFGVSVDKKGASEVHVITGKVKARKNGTQGFVDLTDNQARSFSRDEELAKTIESNPDKFLRVLPGKSVCKPAYIHWSFDEGKGVEACENHLKDGTTNYPAYLRSLRENGEIPQWSNGQFGGSLFFNGCTAYAVTDYPGIGENHPRTVAFWVKAPAPEAMTPVYGLVSWGSMENDGNAWQISVNPIEEDGPLGRLRIGTRNATAIGTTDLRDNRWHHVAVVMYGGDKADVSTHILLYVDGRLEKTSKKSIHRIFTDIESKTSRTVMFGRNMGYPRDDSKVPCNLFKGWMDEVYIFEAALSKEQVNKLLQNNQPPQG